MESVVADIFLLELFGYLRSNGRTLYGVGRLPRLNDMQVICTKHQSLYPALYGDVPGLIARFHMAEITDESLFSYNLGVTEECFNEIAALADFALRSLAPAVFKVRKHPEINIMGSKLAGTKPITGADLLNGNPAKQKEYMDLLAPFQKKDALAHSICVMLDKIYPPHTNSDCDLDYFHFVIGSVARVMSQIMEETDSQRRLVFIGESLEATLRDILKHQYSQVSPALRLFIETLGLRLDISHTFSEESESRILARLNLCAKEACESVDLETSGEPGTRIKKAIRLATVEQEQVIFDNILETVQDCYAILDE